MKKPLLLILLFYTIASTAQIKGKVTSATGEGVPFASVTILETNSGTSTNQEGEYYLSHHKTGTYTLVFRSLGYKTKETEINVNSLPFTLNMEMEPTEYILEDVLVNSKKEQGEAIIRNAIANRKENAKKTGHYEADFYSRGILRLSNVPQEILGQEVGSLGGTLDSTGNGILYLSETVSKIKFKSPNTINEYITASKVSGEDNGFSYNNARAVEFDFYQNYLPFEVNAISPIADYAFSYYNYNLENAFNDKSGFLINKIKVTPKRDSEPAMTGYIYIVDGTWEIYAVNLSIKGLLINTPLVDNLTIKQDFGYNAKNKVWTKNIQVIDFNANFMEVGFSGRFSAVYSNYNLAPQFDNESFSNEVLAFAENSNDKKNPFWSKVRPIPLTNEEKQDYIEKDSLEIIQSSEKYIDSLDKERNRISLFSIPLGYTYYDNNNDRNVHFSGVLRKLGFNTVQAYNIPLTFTLTQYNPQRTSYTKVATTVSYGFAEKRFRASGMISHKFNNISNAKLTLDGGSSIEQFNPENPINRIVNSISTLFFRDNYMKLFDNNFLRLSYEEEVTNGIEVFGSVEYTRKKPLYNNTNFSTIKNADKPYTSNNPLLPEDYETPAFKKHKMVKTSVAVRLSFAQKYMSRPKEKVNLGTKYPRILLKYEKGFASDVEDYNFNHVSSRITYDATVGNVGDLGMSVRAGKFFNSDSISFTDYRHFNGNQTHVGKSERYLNVFNFLPYYTHSTNKEYFEGHIEYNFKGYLANKIPLLNKFNYYLVTGYHVLFVPDQKPYMEYTIGLDNLGWGRFRFFRIDYLRSYSGSYNYDGVVFGITFLDILE